MRRAEVSKSFFFFFSFKSEQDLLSLFSFFLSKASKMDFDDDIFDSFFACIGSVKEAKVISIKTRKLKTFTTFIKSKS